MDMGEKAKKHLKRIAIAFGVLVFCGLIYLALVLVVHTASWGGP